MRLSFQDDFRHLIVQPWAMSPSGGWIAHTPWAGDFGDAAFADPKPDFPFQWKDETLQIEARRNAQGHWQSGLLASGDGEGRGFGQTYGYFEMEAMLPKGEGAWPAFWLMTLHAVHTSETSVEIDALEHYGSFPADFHSGFHVWTPTHDGLAGERVISVPPGSLYNAFHRYGVDVERDFITWYFDRKETWRVKTPPEQTKPLLILLNLALGSGWPTVHTPNPSIMRIAHVRAFRRVDDACKA